MSAGLLSVASSLEWAECTAPVERLKYGDLRRNLPEACVPVEFRVQTPRPVAAALYS